MKQRKNNKRFVLIFIALVFCFIGNIAWAATSCGFSICWQPPRLSQDAEVGDGIYFSSRSGDPVFTWGVIAEGIFEVEDIFDFSPLTASYSIQNTPTWLPADVENHIETELSGLVSDLDETGVTRLTDGRYIVIRNKLRAGGEITAPPFKEAVVFNADGSVLSDPVETDITNSHYVALSSVKTVNNQFVAAYRDADTWEIWSASFSVDDLGGINRIAGTTKQFHDPSSDTTDRYYAPDIVSLLNGVAIVSLANNSRIAARYIPETGEPGPMHYFDLGDGSPQIESLTNGRFVVVWKGKEPANRGIYMQMFDLAGGLLGLPIKVNITDYLSPTGSVPSFDSPKVSTLADGSIVVAWTYGNWSTGRRAAVRRFSSNGAPQTTLGVLELETALVNPVPGVSSSEPFLGALLSGDFLAGINHIVARDVARLDGYTETVTSVESVVKKVTPSGINAGIGSALRFGDSSLQKVIAAPNGLAGLQAESEYYSSGSYDWVDKYTKFILLDGYRKITTPSFSAFYDIDLRYKLDGSLGGQWLSDDAGPLISPRRYIFASFDEGVGGSVSYPDGDYGGASVDIDISMPCEFCNSLRVQRSETRNGGAILGCDPFNEFGDGKWTNISTDTSTIKTQETALLEHEKCYRFRAIARNVYGHEFIYDSPNILRVDRTPPTVFFSSSTVLLVDQLTAVINIQEALSTIVSSTYQINSDAPVAFSGNTFTVTLPEGDSTIRVVVTNSAGHVGVAEYNVDVDLTPAEIAIHGIYDGKTYSDNAEFLFSFSQPLTAVVIKVDGEVRNDFIGLANGEHTLTIEGLDASNRLVTKSVTFFIDNNIFTVNLLSPQQKTYETNAVRIQYSSSHPLTDVWYSLNGGPQQRDLNLGGLADGNYTLQLFGQKVGGATTSVTKTFTVLAAVPILQVNEPRQNAVYDSNQITVSYLSDSQVSYQIGGRTGTITTGGVLGVPADGDHSLLLTATHPVSGYVTSKRIDFKTDSVTPTISLQSPVAGYYPFTEVPIKYTSNKPLTNIQYLLDDVEVTGSVLTGLSNGAHSFQIFAEDSSGRSIVSERVQFAVSHLAIVRPQEGDKVLSDARLPVLPFEYAAEGTFNNFTYALDNGTQLLITDPPGTEILIPVAPGSHEILLRGRFNEFKTVRRARFSIGSKNIAVDSSSIDYEYFNCNADQTECDVNVTIKVSNIGDHDIADLIEVRFDHIGTSGYSTENRVVAGLAIGSTAEITLPTMHARLGDTFSLTLDPFAKISGEWPNDNQHQLPFQSAQITDISLKLPADNAYFQDVSVFEMVKVDTAGPVAMVEYRLGDWTFVDDTAANGFESIVDLGLLSQSNGCMHIVAYGGNGVALDSQSQCFTIKRLALDQLVPMKVDWTPHVSAANRVNINLIDRQQLARDLAQERALAMLRSASILPDVQEDGRMAYTLISNPAGAQGRQVSQPAGLANTPIIGGSVPMPNGHGVFFTVIHPNTDICNAVSAQPILTQPHGEKIAELFQDELADINAMGELGLVLEEELARLWTASIGIPLYTESIEINYYQEESAEMNIDLGGYVIPTYFTGFSYLGWFQVDVPKQLASIDVGGEFIYGFEAKGCRVRDEQDGSVSIVANAKYELGIKDGSFDLSTGRFGLTTVGSLQLGILHSIPVVPTALAYGNVKVYPQHFRLPLEIGTAVDMSIVDEQLSFGPAQGHFQMSINHNTRLAKADIQVYPLFALGFGGGYDFKANLSLNGVAKADWVGGSNDDTGFAYAVFDGSLVIKRRKKVCFMGACYKKKWKHFRTPYSEHVEEGTFYEDVQVAAAVDAVEPFWTADINDLYELALYSIITGGAQQTSQELLACGLFQDLTANMSHSPLYELNGGSCQAIQSPDMGTYSQVFTDPACTNSTLYKATSFLQYCKNNLLPPQSGYFVGNASTWSHDGAPRYDSIGKNSRWTLSHSTRLDITAVSQKNNRRPFLKKAEYRNSFEPINSVPQHQGCSLEMRIYKQDILAENLKPLLYIHGGSWKYRGFGATGMEAAISHYTERGFVVFAPYHRLMGSSDGPVECQGATGRQITSDAEAALAWVKLHGPALGASNAKITLVGQSAGAHLSTWLAVHDTYGADILKSLLFYPPTDFEYFVQQTGPGGVFESPNSFGDLIFEDTRILAGEFLADIGEDPDFSLIDRDNLSPFALENGMPRRIAEGAAFAPTFIIHGNGDELVPVEVSMRLCDAAAGVPFGTTSKDAGNYACGTDSHLKIIEGANHILDLKCFAADIIDPSILNVLTGHVPSFDVTMSCPSGLVGAAPAREAIESALQWIN